MRCAWRSRRAYAAGKRPLDRDERARLAALALLVAQAGAASPARRTPNGCAHVEDHGSSRCSGARRRHSLATAALLSPAGRRPALAGARRRAGGRRGLSHGCACACCAMAPRVRFPATRRPRCAGSTPTTRPHWLPTLGSPSGRADTVEVENGILFDMSQGRRFDVYAMPVAVLMFDALNAVATSLPGLSPAAMPAAGAVISVASARLVPSFTTYEEACRDRVARHGAAGSLPEDRRNACSTATPCNGELAGIAIEKRTLARPTRRKPCAGRAAPRAGVAGRAGRPFRYARCRGYRARHARWHLAEMRALPREQDVVLCAILREQGSPLGPPAAPPLVARGLCRNNLDFHQRAGATSAATCTALRAGLFGCSAVPKNFVSPAIEPGEVHLVLLGRVRDHEDRHLDDIAHAEPSARASPWITSARPSSGFPCCRRPRRCPWAHPC